MKPADQTHFISVPLGVILLVAGIIVAVALVRDALTELPLQSATKLISAYLRLESERMGRFRLAAKMGQLGRFKTQDRGPHIKREVRDIPN